MIADSYTELEAAQLLVLRAAHLKEIHQPFTKEASMAKLFTTLLILFLSLLSCAFIFLFLNKKKAGNDDILTENDAQIYTEKDYDNFRVEHISVITKRDSKPHFILTADEVVHRKRASKLFLYQNLKEIYVSGAKVDIYLNNTSSSGNSSPPFDEMNENFASLGKQPTSLDDYSAGKVADSDLDLLSRIFFDNSP